MTNKTMGNDFILLIPQIVLVIAAMALMLLEPFTPAAHKSRMARIAVLAAAVAAFSLGSQWSDRPRTILDGMYAVDNFSVFFQWLFLVILAVSAIISMKFNEREGINRGEYYSLLLFASSGMCLMVSSSDLILTFIGIEILSIATYVLAGFKRADIRSNEASLKYFLLGSFATAFLLYGIALIYGSTGSTNYQTIRELASMQGGFQNTTLIGMGLLLVGFGFKIALVPFHSWAPDVYEGAPTPVTAFMTVGPKAAGFATLIRILVEAVPFLADEWSSVLWLLSILTMILGNVVAVLQTNVKRMLAYSAIAHAGYILVGIVTNSGPGYSAVLFYLVVYTIMNMIAFSVILSVSGSGDTRVYLKDYTGMARRSPFAAAALSLSLVSLAGIPLTGGFIGKFFLFSAAVRNGYIGLAVIGVLTSLVSVFYYFRLLVIMYMKDPDETAAAPEPMSWLVQAVIVMGVVGILWLGIFPDQILNLADFSILAPK
ncbi:MAG: NADH-quinone oxidoreductase subunit N [Acidobacteria bacterium]|nr:NADH-quinone oxidoreductase subunit N [Acidobacteriota bacterium]